MSRGRRAPVPVAPAASWGRDVGQLYVTRSTPTIGDMPPGVVTMTSAVEPVVPTGAFAVMTVSLVTVKEVAAAPLKVTLVAPVKNLPLIVTVVPPRWLTWFGLTPVTIGVGYSWTSLDLPVARPMAACVKAAIREAVLFADKA